MSPLREIIPLKSLGSLGFLMLALWFAMNVGAETSADSARADPINLSCKVGEKVITYRIARIEVIRKAESHTEFWVPSKDEVEVVLQKGLAHLVENQPAGESPRFSDFMDDFVYGVVGNVHHFRGKEMKIIGRMGVLPGDVPGELRIATLDGPSRASVLLVFDHENQSFTKASFSLHPWLVRDIEW